MIIGNTQMTSMPIVKHKNENNFEGFVDNFKITPGNKNNRILKNPKFESIFHEKEDIFYCDKNNQINDKDCYMYNELCKNCLMLNQAYHKLKKIIYLMEQVVYVHIKKKNVLFRNISKSLH